MPLRCVRSQDRVLQVCLTLTRIIAHLLHLANLGYISVIIIIIIIMDSSCVSQKHSVEHGLRTFTAVSR